MAGINPGPRLGNLSERSPYWAFRSDRDRLWALISRDVRLVLIAVLVAAGSRPAASFLSQLWAFIVKNTS